MLMALLIRPNLHYCCPMYIFKRIRVFCGHLYLLFYLFKLVTAQCSYLCIVRDMLYCLF
jgi:hypothetical protein